MATRPRRPLGALAQAFGEEANGETRVLSKPQMRYVPALSLPQMMQARHIERHLAKVEAGLAAANREPERPPTGDASASARGRSSYSGDRSPSPSRVASPTSFQGRLSPALSAVAAAAKSPPTLAAESASAGAWAGLVGGTKQGGVLRRSLIRRGVLKTKATPAFSSVAPVPGAAAARSRPASEGMGHSAFCFGALAAKRRVHPRLRWPRLQNIGEANLAEGDLDGLLCTVGGGSGGADLLRGGVATPEESSVQGGAPSVAKSSASTALKDKKGKARPVSKVSQEIITRPAILPRVAKLSAIVAGTIATLHAPGSPGHEDIEGAETGKAKYNSEAASDASADSDSGSSLCAAPGGAAGARGGVGGGVAAGPRQTPSELNKLDRKWFIRVAPISCLPGSTSANAAKKALLSSADASAAHHQGKVEKALIGEGGEYLSFENWGLNDDYVDALLSAHCGSSEHGLESVRFVNLSHNQLTQAGIGKLLSYCRPESIMSLNLASNRLHERGAHRAADLITSCRHLQDLDLSDNALSDAFLESLCSLIRVHCLELNGMALAKCGIGSTPRGGDALGSLVGAGRLLTSLDLTWNRLHGEGAQSFIRGVYENGVVTGGKLRRLNLAWNRLGSGTVGADDSRRREAKAVAKALAEVFRHNTTLFHMDLAYNSFSADDCAIIGEGLATNHTLFGLHLIGNEAAIDSMGFIVPLRRGADAVKAEASTGLKNRTGAAPAAAAKEGPEQPEGEAASEDDKQSKQEKVEDSAEDGGYTCQMVLNSLVNAVPSKFRLDHPADFVVGSGGGGGGKQGQKEERVAHRRTGAAAGGASLQGHALKQNPALRTLANSSHQVAPFSEEDLELERQYASYRSRVRTIAGDYDSVQVNAKCCWICENWVEHKLVFDPASARTDEAANDGHVHTVYVFYSIDGFTRPTVLKPQEVAKQKVRVVPTHGAEVGSKVVVRKRSLSKASLATRKSTVKAMKFVGSRMLPRSLEPLQIVFVVNGSITISADLPQRPLPRRKVLPPCPDQEGLETAKEFSCVNIIGAGCGNAASMGGEEVQAWHLPNALCVVEDASQTGEVTCVPRSWKAVVREKKEVWSFQKSVFKDFTMDLQTLVEECLETDWQNGRVSQIIRSGEARTEIFQKLSPIYLQVMVAFWWEAYGELEAKDQACGVSMMDFRAMMSRYGGEGRGALVDGQSCKFSDCDCIFVAANVVERSRRVEFPVLPFKALSRFQFLEAVVRLAIRRFLHSGGPPREISPAMYRQAIDSFMRMSRLGDHVLKLRAELHKELFTESCSQMFEEYVDLLRPVFNHYRSLGKRPGEKKKKKTLAFSSWLQLMKDAQVVDEGFTQRDVGHAFSLAKEVRCDETTSMRHMELSWSEFLVGLGAIVKLMTQDEKDTEDVSFADLLDEFLLTHMQEAYDNLVKSPRQGDNEFVQLLALLEQVFSDLEKRNGGGVVSLRQYRQHFDNPSIKADMPKSRITVAEVCVFYNILWQQISEQQTDAIFINDEVNLEEICSCVLKMKEALRGFDRAIAYIERSFDEYDLDHSGTLDREEFQTLVEEPTLVRKLQTVGFDTDEFAKIFQVLDEEGMGQVSMEQVAEGFMCIRDSSFAARRGVKLLQRHYQKIGGKSKGNLNKEQVLATFDAPAVSEKLTSMNLTVPDWSTMFEELDLDASGDLDWEEIGDGMFTFWQNNWRLR